MLRYTEAVEHIRPHLPSFALICETATAKLTRCILAFGSACDSVGSSSSDTMPWCARDTQC